MPIGETADMLGVSVDTVRRWEKQGHLVSKRLDGKNRYFALDHVLEVKQNTGLTIDEAADELKVSTEEINVLIRAGKLPLAKTTSGESVIKRSVVQGYANNRATLRPKRSIGKPKVASESIPSQSTTSFAPSQPPGHPGGRNKASKVKERLSHRSRSALLALSRGKNYLAKTSLRRIILAILATVGIIVLLLATLFLFAPERMGRMFAYSGVEDTDSGFSKPDTNIFIRGLRPLTDTALGVVEFVNPEVRQEVAPNTVPNANELFSIDADGNVTSNYPFSFKDSAYLRVPDNGLVENLNSQYVQGYAPGSDSGSLAILPIRGNDLVEGSVTGDAIAERVIAISHLSPSLQSMLSNGSSGARGPAGPQGPASDSGSGSGITGVNAGAGLQGGGSTGYLNIDISTGNSTQVISDAVEVRLSASSGTSTTGSSSGLEITSNGLQLLGGCSTNQVLAWSGTGWVCSAQSSGGSLTTQSSDSSTIVSNTTNIQFGPAASSTNEFILTNLGSGQARLTLGSNVLQSTNYASTLDPIYVNVTETLSGGDITGSFSGGLVVGADSVALGADTTGNFVATVSGSNGLSVSGSGSESAMVNLSLDVTTTGTTSTISSNSGLELTTDGLRLLGGCSPSEILKWNGTNWLCSADNSSALNIEENDGLVLSNASVIDFLGSDFAITSAGGEADVSIDYANSGIARRTATEIISGNWTFNDSSFTLQDNSDNTKKLLIELSSIGGGTTRTLSAPNASGTIVTTGNLTDITAVGTITSGVWQGSTIGVQYGGTGTNTLATNGVLYGNGTGAVQATTAGTAGQLLVANASGIPSFVGLSGDASLSSAGLLTLANSGVTANTYGSATQVPVFTVNAKGRITSASNTTISGVAPGGSAGGDLSGSYPNPTVARINGSTLGATTTDAGNILVANGASWISRAITGDITVGGTGAFTINADSVALGTDTTGSYVASIAGGAGLSVVGSGSENAAVTINLDVATTGTTGTTNSNSGLEIGSDGVRLLGGCGTGQILKWNGTTWACATDDNAGSLTAQENDVTVTGSASTLDFLGDDFNLSETPAGEVNISVDYVNSGIARLNQNETVAGSWTFNSTGFTLQDSVTPSKKLAFDVSGVSPATTRTLAIPDVNGTIVSTGNLNSITAVGTVASGTWQGGVIGSAYGGTGLDTSTAANGSILIGNGAGLSLGTLTQGSGITITNGAGSITIAASLGTSVDLTSEVTGTLPIANGGTGATTLTDLIALGSHTTGSYVQGITAGAGLTGDVSSESATANLAIGAGNGISVAADSVSVAVQANKGLEVDGSGLSLIDCSGSEILKYNGSTSQWECAADNGTGAAPTLQDGYDNDPDGGNAIIGLSNTDGGLFVRDNATPLGTRLFAIQNSSGTTTYLDVDATGVSITGALDASGNINTSSGAIQTAGTTRLDSSGNLTNIGNLTASGALVISNSGASNDISFSSVDQIIINAGSTIELQDNTNVAGNLGATGTITAATFSGDLTGNVTGNADTASALAANPSDCAANQFATTIAANGDLTCAALTDADVPDGLTISALGSVADGALSSNVTLLGATITKDELTNSGTLGFTWSDSEISDAITVGALGSVSDSALSSNVSLLGASIESSEIANGEIINEDLASGSFANILGTGALDSGSITSNFGAIDNGASNITTTGIIGSAGNATFTGNSATLSGTLAINGVGGITSSQGTLVVNAGGNVDVQDTLTVNNLIADVGGVSIAAGQAYTGSGAVTVSSGGSASLTLDSGSDTIVLAASDTTLQRNASGNFTIDLANSAATTLVITNSNSGVASLSVEGSGTFGNALTVSAGGASISGGINANSGGLTNAGAISGATTISASGNINTSGGAIQTNGTTRLTNGGALQNITTILASGNINTTAAYQQNGTSGITLDCAADQFIGNQTVSGGIATAGSCEDDTAFSDERLKENVIDLESDILDKIRNVRTVSFDYKCEDPALSGLGLSCDGQYGVIAQELMQLFPELVKEHDSGYYRVDYDALAVMNLRAVTEIAKHIDSAGNANFGTVDADKIFASGIGQSYPAGDNNLSAGDVVYVDQSGLVRQSTSPNQTGLLGVVSSAGGVIIGEQKEDTITVAAAGKVTTRVSTENGPIVPGDYLTSSSIPGVAMRSDGRSPTFGMAATGFSGAGEGRIEVTVGVGGSLSVLAGDVDTISDRIASIEQEVATIVENGLSQQDNSIDYTNFTVENLNVTHDLFVSKALIIEGDSTFNGEVFFNKVANFRDSVVFDGAVSFNNAIKVGDSNAGYAVIRQGANSVVVEFVQPHETAPIVTASLMGGFEDYTVTNVTRYGFEILLREQASRDIELSWTAIEMLNPPINLNE